MSEDNNKPGAAVPAAIEPVLHCCACSRIFRLPEGSQPGTLITCPFCHTKQVLRTMTVYVSEPLVAA